MKSAAAIFFLAVAFLAAPPAPGREETAVERLGVAFRPPAASPSAPPGAPASPASSLPVVILPKFDVRRSRLDLDEHELLTPRGRLAVAKKQELSPLYQVTFGPLAVVAAVYFDPLSLLAGIRANDAEAMALFAQDERLRRMHEADSLLEIDRLDDPAGFKELKASLRDTFQLDPPTGLHLP